MSAYATRAEARKAIQPGFKFGRWTAIERTPGSGTRWQCTCSCGTSRSVDGKNLREGRSKSCGRMQAEAMRPAYERFWEYVDKRGPDECWLWQGGKSTYGRFRLGRKSEGQVAAHRFSYELQHGPSHRFLNVLHRCDVPRCVNPAHLFLGDARDNILDCLSKGRGAGQFKPGPDSRRQGFSTKQRVEIFVARKGVCAICNTKIYPKAFEIEHRIPLAMGGTNDFTNLDVVHADCHKAKTRKDVRDIAKAVRVQAQHIGAKRSRNPMPGSRQSPWKRKMSGEWVRR